MRCAIYTRKSHDDAPESSLSSIENQRDMCERYVSSQAGEGWSVLKARYDDLGFTGANTARPGLVALAEDVNAGLVDTVVVYKIDRLSRSLRDFVNLIELFDRRRVTFVSVTQHFSTTNSMGRLTLNILLTFAQFEREMIGERTRDWIAGARSRGIWTNGIPPYGYRTNKGRLVVYPEPAKVVRFIYARFPQVMNYSAVAREVNALGHKNRLGLRFDGRLIKAVLTSRIYRGELNYTGICLPRNHGTIISEAVWRRARTAVEERESSVFARVAHRRENEAVKREDRMLDHKSRSVIIDNCPSCRSSNIDPT